MRIAASILAMGIALCATAQTKLFQEPYRPQYHFTPPVNWTNDPNGLVYHQGTYHLFYQFNPFGNEWGHMTWAHATSKDLLHWKQAPIALKEENGIMMFSGSAVWDKDNSSGFGKGTSPLVAIYTGHTDTLQTQNLAYSVDGGTSWKKYTGNPVLDLHKKDFRDPNVFWYAPTKNWIMAVSQPIEHQISFYGSKNLKDWKHLSNFGPAGDTSAVWECPDLMPLPVLGSNGKTKWVLYTSQNSTMQYFVGEFDGQQFLSDNPTGPILKQDHGLDYYAAVAYYQTANKDIVSIGWVNSWNYANAIPTKPWKGAMSLPRKLALKKMGDEYQLVQTPIDALKTLRQTVQTLPNKSFQNTETLLLKGSSYEMQFRLIPGAQTQSGIRLAVGAGRYLELGYDASKQVLYLDRSKTPSAFNARYAELSRAEAALPNKGKIDLRIFLDASILEVYAADGTVVMTAQVFPEPGDTGIQLFSQGGISQFEGIQFWKMGSVH